MIGVDDFAFRRGKKYGAILVDHERRCMVDLLPDREAVTLAQWLKSHPGLEVVTRDRSRAYASRRFFPKRLRKEVIERRDKHIALYNEVIELRQKGLSTEEIAKRVGKSPRTIRHWLQQGEYRERVRHRRSLLDAHSPYIAQRWDEGCRNVMELWRELVALGYRGSYKSLTVLFFRPVNHKTS